MRRPTSSIRSVKTRKLSGAGGVPVRSEADYAALFVTSLPAITAYATYSGTDDFIKLAEIYLRSIHNAWCAIPLFWFNAMDGDYTGPSKHP